MTSSITRVAARLAPTHLTDGQLLARFRDAADEAAFALLVRRHGPTVLGVCRRILGSPDDAEDAFQATFLVLLHRAGGLAHRATVGGWLHGVAVRVAMKSRMALARRRKHESAASARRREAIADPPVEEWGWFDRELAALPVLFREPLVLCLIQGKPRAEAAALLGIPEGTLASRLDAARKRLAERLAHHHLPLATGGLLAVVPPALAEATTDRAADGVSILIHQLAHEVSTAMTTTKWSMLIASGLLTAALGGLLLAAPEPTPDPTPPKVQVRRNAPVPPKAKWKREFDKIYSLEEGELVKIIPRDEQPDCRKEFIRDWLVTEYKIKPADIEEAFAEAQEVYCFAFDVDANGKRRIAYRLDAAFTQAERLRENCIGVRFDEYLASAGIIQGFEWTIAPEAFLKFDQRVLQLDNPDLILRADAPLDKLIPALDKAFDERLKAKFRIDWKVVEQEVWVASGKVDIKPRAWRKANQVDVYVNEANINKKTFAHGHAGGQYPKPDHETGTAKRFLTFLQVQLQTHVLWVDDTPPEKPQFDWTHHWGERRSYTASNSEMVLKNVSEQTGLTFKKEKRKVPMLVISPR